MQVSVKTLLSIGGVVDNTFIGCVTSTIGSKFSDSGYTLTQDGVNAIYQAYDAESASRPNIGDETIFGVMTQEEWTREGNAFYATHMAAKNVFAQLGYTYG